MKLGTGGVGGDELSSDEVVRGNAESNCSGVKTFEIFEVFGGRASVEECCVQGYDVTSGCHVSSYLLEQRMQ